MNLISGEPLGVENQRKLKAYLTDELARSLSDDKWKGKNQTIAGLEALDLVYKKTKVQLSEPARRDMFDEIISGLGGFGLLQPLLDDETVTEVMVNGPSKVYVERKGKLEKVDIHFENDEQVIRIIANILRPLGRTINRDILSVDARLPDGSRVNAIIPPLAIDGPSITIRKFPKERLGIRELIQFGAVNQKVASLLGACVNARLNIIISGGTGSGKTTLLNVLSSFIPHEERIITIEDAAELQLQQEHVLRLETKPADLDRENEVTVRALLRNALRMRPDRIVVGEVRGGEALDMLQAMNTGHDGSLTTVHANAPRDAISRLETLVLMAGFDLPLRTVRQQIASAVDVIVQQARFADGSRKVSCVTEVAGMEGDTVTMTDIFKYEQTGTNPAGQVQGELRATGLRPNFMARLKSAGFDLPTGIFAN